MRRGERGQALPLAIMALAIGTLVVTPFLGHASASLISARVYGEVIARQAAGDAGVEHAIWSLTRGNLAEAFTNPGDEVSYQLGEAVNGLTTTVTITANATPSGGTPGEIANAVIDSFNFDNAATASPNIIRVSGNTYAIAHTGANSDGFVTTLQITPGGDIGTSIIDTLEFDTSDGLFPAIIPVSGTTYAIAYQGPGNNGYIKTVSITAAGDVGNSVIDSLEFDATNGREPAIIKVADGIFAIAYRGPANDGFIITVSIAGSGDIGNSVIDTLEYDTADGYQPDIIHVAGNVYAIAYQGPGSDGYIKTVSITPAGDIGNSAIDSLDFDTTSISYPAIINVSGNIYAVAYQGSGFNGFLKTVSITTAGDIGNSVIDTLEFDTSNGREPKIIFVSGDTYAIAYRGPNNDGFLKTVSIAPGGDIAGSVIDTLEYDTSDGYQPDIIKIATGVYAIAYSGPVSRGYIKTVGITESRGTAAAWEIVATAGGGTIRAFVNTDNTTASIVSWRVE